MEGLKKEAEAWKQRVVDLERIVDALVKRIDALERAQNYTLTKAQIQAANNHLPTTPAPTTLCLLCMKKDGICKCYK